MLTWIARIFAAGLVAMTGGYIALVGQTGLNPTNHNLCDLYKSVTGLPYVSCKFEFLILTIWKYAAIIAFLYLLFEVFRWGRKFRREREADRLAPKATLSQVPQPNMSLRDAVEYVVGTSKWLGSGEGVVTAMADFIESVPQQAVLENIRSWGRKGGIGKVQSPLIPIDASYWADHVFDLAEFYRNGSGVTRHFLSSDYLPHEDFNDVHFDKDQITKFPRAQIKQPHSTYHPLKVEVGTDIDFYELVRDRIRLHSYVKRFKIRVENDDPARTISGIKVAVTSVDPLDGNYRFPWVLSENGSINPGDHALVPLAIFEERRDPDKYPDRPYTSDTFEVPAISDRTLLLGIENEHTFQVRCTANDIPAVDTRIKISFVAGRARIEKV